MDDQPRRWTATLLVDGSADLLPEDVVEVDGASFQHLCRARRLGSGEVVQVVDGLGARALASVGHVGRRSAELRILERLEPESGPSRSVCLWIAQPKLERASWAVEKLTELAVMEIVFWRSERSQADYAPRQVERLRRVCVSALEQSGGARLPGLRCNASWGELTAAAGGLAVLDVAGEGDFAEPEPSSLSGLVIGPEGGWSAAERDRFTDLGWRRLRIGSRVLRVETAAIVGAARLLGPA